MVRVFVADDSASIRERINKMVASIPGVEVSGEAIDGVEASVMIRKTKPDLVILDLQMPKISGLEILPAMKEIDPPPIVVVLTNYSTSPLKAMCIKRGADYFFDKSTEFEKAVEVIEKISRTSAGSAT